MVRFSLREKIVSGKHFPVAVCFCQSGGAGAPEPPLQSGEAKNSRSRLRKLGA
jgi:hypothetical protein